MFLESRLPRIAVLALFVAFAAAALGPPSQAATGGDADLRELSRYQLTLTEVRKYAAANANLAKHPKVAEDEDAEGDSEDDTNDESLDGMAARIGKIPEARKAIESAGLTVRQYAVITMALIQASMAQFAVDSGADPAKVARDAGVNPANIKFVKEHKAELQKMQGMGGSD
jgi:hypothetical protein